MINDQLISVLSGLDSVVELQTYLNQEITMPYVILDSLFRIIACNGEETGQGKFFETIRRECYVSADMVKKICTAMNVDELPTEFSGQITLNDEWVYVYFCVSKRKNLLISALLSIRLDQPYSLEEQTILKNTAEAYGVGQRMLKINEVLRSEYEEAFIRNLLHGRYRNHDELMDEFKRTKITQKKYIYVFTVTPVRNIGNDKSEGNNQSIRFFLNEFRNRFLNSSTVVVRNKYLVTILSTDDTIYEFENELYKINNFLMKENMVLCCSNGVKDLKDIPVAYNQTLKCLQFIEMQTLVESRIKLYYKFALRHLYKEISIDKNITDFCHPAIDLLLDYDERYGTELAKTLFVYLKNCQQVSVTAQDLYVHRNTLSSRLEKINALTKIDFKNGTELGHLIVSYEMINNGYRIINYNPYNNP